jgi:hypothetical protein
MLATANVCRRSADLTKAASMRTTVLLSTVSLVLLACGDSPTESRTTRPEQITAVLEQVSDVRIRVIPALTDRVAAEGIAAELMTIEVAANSDGSATSVNAAFARARLLLNSYGTTNGAAATDAPDLEVIRMALDKTLEALEAGSFN